MTTIQFDRLATDDMVRPQPVRENADPIGGLPKRMFDILFSSVTLIAAMPFFLALPLLIFIVSRGPVFFVHHRVGHGGKLFPCLKFRTMVLNADKVLERHLAASPQAREEFRITRKLKKDPRILPIIGSFIRKSSFDEFPQFLNVLRGDMSVVGPRPVTPEELDSYGEAAARYKSARPGITGLWQVSGRNDLTFGKRVELDTRYINKWSFLTDAGIIIRTIGVMFNSKGAY